MRENREIRIKGRKRENREWELQKMGKLRKMTKYNFIFKNCTTDISIYAPN